MSSPIYALLLFSCDIPYKSHIQAAILCSQGMRIRYSHAHDEEEILIAGELLQSREHIFKHQYRDYSHHASRAKESC